MTENIIIGYSGHAYVVIDSAATAGIIISGYCEMEEKGNNPFHLKYWGQESQTLLKYTNWFVGIGDNRIRRDIYYKLNGVGKYLTIVNKSATVSLTADIEIGSFIGANVSVNAFAKIGKGAIINTGSIIEHECIVGDFSHIAPGAVLAGNVTIGENCFIGANSVIKEGVQIGEGAIIGAGSVIIRDVPSNVIIVGNPGKILNKQK